MLYYILIYFITKTKYRYSKTLIFILIMNDNYLKRNLWFKEVYHRAIFEIVRVTNSFMCYIFIIIIPQYFVFLHSHRNVQKTSFHFFNFHQAKNISQGSNSMSIHQIEHSTGTSTQVERQGIIRLPEIFLGYRITLSTPSNKDNCYPDF